MTSISWPCLQAAIAQLGERQTEDLKVPGSIPGLGMSPTPCAALGAVVAQRRGHWQKASAFFQTSLPMTSVLTITRATLPSRPIGLFFKHSVTSRDSSVGRASDRRSEGPRFDLGSRHVPYPLCRSRCRRVPVSRALAEDQCNFCRLHCQ